MPGPMFGPWVGRVDDLARAMASARPFPHVVIPNFFEDPGALAAAFPESDHPGWLRYDNPLERKHAMPAVGELGGPIAGAFDALKSDEFVSLMRRVSGIADLEHDPHLHGAGLHAHPRGGKLDVHLDYSIHPISGMERRLNLIVFLNPRWRDEWGGHLQLWSADMASAESITPAFNTAVLFQTCDSSWHGLPEPVRCPENERRMSLATYYVSPPRPGAARRTKAEFVPRPGQPVDEKLANLYAIRPRRRIEDGDLWDGWEEDGGGVWW